VSAVLLYIGAGCIGLPVFAGGKSGIATLWGPTGGYLVSYAVAVYITACKDKLPKASLAMTFALCLLLTLAAEAVILGAGGAWCGWLLGYSPAKVFSVLVLPFLPGDIAKDIAAVGIYLYLRKHGLLPR
jgi:biotin transport system substrate-specific component